MYRREALRRLAAVGVATALAGCGSGASHSDAPRPPEPPEGGGQEVEAESGLRVASIDYREDDSGSLVLVVGVANGDDQSRSGTLRATVQVGDEETVETAEVTVAADDSETVEVPFGIAFADFEQNGSIDLELE